MSPLVERKPQHSNKTPDSDNKGLGSTNEQTEALLINSDNLNTSGSKNVSTLELHSVEQTSSQHETLTFTECPAFEEKLQEGGLVKKVVGEAKVEESFETAMEVDGERKEKKNEGIVAMETEKITTSLTKELEHVDRPTALSDLERQGSENKDDIDKSEKAAEGFKDTIKEKVSVTEGKEEAEKEDDKSAICKETGESEKNNIIEEVQAVLTNIEDMIDELNTDGKTGNKAKKSEPIESNTSGKGESSEQKEGGNEVSKDKSEEGMEVGKDHCGDSQGSATNPAMEDEMDETEEAEIDIKKDPKFMDQLNNMLKLPVETLHKDLIEKCRKAVIMCLQRFSTHYKSHYRLAYIYVHSPYHKVSILVDKH